MSPTIEQDARRISAGAQGVLEAVAEIIPLLGEYAETGEHLTRLAPESVAALDSAGVFRAATPLELGGSGFSLTEQVEIFAEVARGDGSAGWMASTTAAIPTFCTAFPQEAIDELLNTSVAGPVAAGSVFAPNQGTARKVDGGWLVKGTWKYCSGVQLAPWLVGGVEATDGAATFAGMVLLCRDQYEIADDWHVLGMRATNTNTAFIEDEQFVPDHRFVSRGDTNRHLSEPGHRFPPAAAVGPLMASVGLGIARGALESFCEQVQVVRPAGPTPAASPVIQLAAGRAEAIIETAFATMRSEAGRTDAMGVNGEQLTPEGIARSHLIASHLIRQCTEAVDLVLSAAGASAAFDSNPLQRAMRDIHVLGLHITMRFEMHAITRGRALLGLEVESTPLQT